MPLAEAAAILNHFAIPRRDYAVLPVRHGLINRSYKVTDKATGKPRYFLQQIDHHIFKDVEGLMHNIKQVTAHFELLPNPPGHLTTVNSGDKNYYRSPAGAYWRLYPYVDGNTYIRAGDRQLATEAGRMFGQFLKALSGLPPGAMVITIPRFHDIDWRYQQFQASLGTAGKQRLRKAAWLIRLVEENISAVQKIYHNIVHHCPLRVVHNDTKLSNLLFDGQQRGLCVVDYDTLMPGYIPLDFGDAIRSLASTTVEDDPDTGRTFFNRQVFAAFTPAFIKALGNAITKAETSQFANSVPYMPFLMGLRMLTDYLNNDSYYTTRYAEHNYHRAANQLTLYSSGMALMPEMNKIVNKTVSALN